MIGYIFSQKFSISALRISLGIVYFWFGALKVAGYNPVYEIVYSTYPFFVSKSGNLILGALEFAIGLGLLFNIFRHLTHLALFLHLLGTFLVFFTAPELMFDPYFPILTLSGEFVFKNAVLALAGLAVFAH